MVFLSLKEVLNPFINIQMHGKRILMQGIPMQGIPMSMQGIWMEKALIQDKYSSFPILFQI